jgi:hypothetical protein
MWQRGSAKKKERKTLKLMSFWNAQGVLCCAAAAGSDTLFA